MFLSDERRDEFLPLTRTGMPAEAVRRLEGLGITTLEELRDTWTYGNHQLLTDYLGESPVRFTMVRPGNLLTRSAAATGPGESVNLLAAGPVRPIVRHARGLNLSTAQLSRKAEAPDPVALGGRRRGGASASPERVSLIDRFPPVRDQGQRGTCVAFASLAYLEYHLADASAKVKRRSEQFLYWAAKQYDGNPQQEGTHLAAVRKALKNDGVCAGTTWKYVSMPVLQNEGQGPPPARAVAEAKQNRWSKTNPVAHNDVDALRDQLDQGRPVVLGVTTFPSWDYPIVADTGEVNLPIPNTQPDGGHAICLVGYEPRPGVGGGGVFLFRNSWGKTWAGKSRIRAGYGTLFFEYIRKYAVDAYC